MSLGNGELLSFNARQFYRNHRQREIGSVKITALEAKKYLNPGLEVIGDEGLVLIRNGEGKEVLAYKFRAALKLQNEILEVYINADTGKEEVIEVGYFTF